MSVTPERPPGVGPPDGHDTPSWPSGRPLWQQFLVGAIGVLLVVGVILAVVRVWAIPALQSRGADAGIAGEATLAALQTQQALTPRPTATNVVVPAGQPTVAPTAGVRTPAPTAVPTVVVAVAPTVQPTQEPAAAPAVQPTVDGSAVNTTGSSVPSVNGTPYSLPTASTEMVKTVSVAYLQFWSVYRDAFLSLDPTPLAQVAAGDELTVLQHDIEANRAQGRALKVDLQHEFSVVIATGDQAVVSDDIHDGSIYVDPDTQEPLAGQTPPPSLDQAPEYKGVYKLELIDNTWKVTEGTGP